jgi:putative ABC transport system permease protein
VNVVRAGRAEPDLAREVASHLALLEDEFVRRGMSVDDARAAARRAFGGVEQAKDVHRDARSFIWLDDLRRDVHYAARTLRRNPLFAAIAVATLALGVGGNAIMFSVVDAVLLRPLPWADPDHTVMIWSRWVAENKTWVAEGEVNDYRRENRTMTGIAAWDTTDVNLTGNGEAERVPAGEVTANTFATFGVAPIFGRVFTDAEDRRNGPNVVILGAGLWQRRYGGDPTIVGRTIQIDGRPYEVVGIMPAGFLLPTDFGHPAPTMLWLPLGLDPASTDHVGHGLFAAGRLKPGVTIAQAQDDFHRIARNWVAKGLYPRQPGFDNLLLTGRDEVVGRVRLTIWLLFGAVGVLLLIACVNVANLLLARAEARRREIAVRMALGAGAWRVVRQLMTENLLLAGVGGGMALLVDWAGARVLAWWSPSTIPRVAGISVDGRVLAFTGVLALATMIVFGIAPAAQLVRGGLVDRMKDQNPNTTVEGRRFRQGLVVAEMALAVVLLTAAGLMLRTLWSLRHVDLGFRPAGVLTMTLSLPPTAYQSADQVVGFYDRLLGGVRALPGVAAAGAARSLPLAATIGWWDAVVDGYTPPAGATAKGDWEIVTDGYIETMGETVVRGRSFSAADTAGSPLVGLINEEMARRYWGGRDPLGGRFRISRRMPYPWITVVGIVKDVRHNGLTTPANEKFYVPQSQWPRAAFQWDDQSPPVSPIRSMTLVVKSAGDPASVAASVRAVVRRLDPNLPVADVRTMDDVVGAALSTPRFTSMLLSTFAALALVLSAIGTYGVLSYIVSRRTREIGIRVAIGAGRGQVLTMVMSGGVSLALMGIGAGLVMALGMTRVLRGLLYGVTPLDPPTFAAVAVGLTAVAALASALPAWRASRVDPVIALKSE